MRERSLGIAQQDFVDVAYALLALPGTTAVGVHHQVGGGSLGQQRPLQGTGDQGSEHISPHLPVHHVLGADILKYAQVILCHAGSAGKGCWAAFCHAYSCLVSIFRARAVASVERLSLIRRRASARKAAS